MNERVTDERLRQATGLSVDSQRPTFFGSGVRIDPAHSLGDPHPPEAELTSDAPTSELSVPLSTSDLRRMEASKLMPGSKRLDTRALNEVSQLVQQLHLQIESEKEDLESREQALRDQLSLFEVEKQRFIHQIANAVQITVG